MPERYRYKDMKERKIKMTPEEVKDFVNKASQCDFDIDIFSRILIPLLLDDLTPIFNLLNLIDH